MQNPVLVWQRIFPPPPPPFPCLSSNTPTGLEDAANSGFYMCSFPSPASCPAVAEIDIGGLKIKKKAGATTAAKPPVNENGATASPARMRIQPGAKKLKARPSPTSDAPSSSAPKSNNDATTTLPANKGKKRKIAAPCDLSTAPAAVDKPVAKAVQQRNIAPPDAYPVVPFGSDTAASANANAAPEHTSIAEEAVTAEPFAAAAAASEYQPIPGAVHEELWSATTSEMPLPDTDAPNPTDTAAPATLATEQSQPTPLAAAASSAPQSTASKPEEAAGATPLASSGKRVRWADDHNLPLTKQTLIPRENSDGVEIQGYDTFERLDQILDVTNGERCASDFPVKIPCCSEPSGLISRDRSTSYSLSTHTIGPYLEDRGTSFSLSTHTHRTSIYVRA